MTTRTEERVSAYSRALERFARWLAAHRQPDGSLELPSRACVAYTAQPVYAHAVGNTEWLARSLRIIEDRCRDDADTFLHPPSNNLIPYRAAWMLLGAVFGQQFTLARWLEIWMLRFSHRGTGGFFGTEAARQAGHGTICFDSTTQACAALCVAGNIAAAERLGEFLKRLVQSQPDPQRRLLCVWDTERGLLAEFDPKEALSYVIEWDQPGQYLYKIGLLARAFALLHARTGQTRYLDLAESVYHMAITQSLDPWHNTLAHKLGWAGHTLWSITRKSGYVENACRMADRLVSLQQEEGGFDYPEYLPPYDQVSPDLKCNYGAQFCTWIGYARTMLLVSNP